MNHSCEPNSGVLKKNSKLFLIAISNIKIGDELLMDYSTILAPDDIWEMNCNCGSNKCRSVIKKFNKIPKRTKEEYISLGIVPKYILE